MGEIICHICEKSFSSKESLKQHVDAKHKNPLKKTASDKQLSVIKYALIAGFLLLMALFINSLASIDINQYDGFSKCLTEKNTKLYSAFWCSNCKVQKQKFLNSFKYINLIECSTPDGKGRTQACIDAEIKGYPTWEFGDGSRLSGHQSLETLSEKTGCPLK